MNKSTKGLLLIAVAAGLGWLLWRRRQTPEARTGTQTDSLANIGQLGGDTNQNLTPEVVSRAFDFATEQINKTNCWTFTGRAWGTPPHQEWLNNATGKTAMFPLGQPPKPACGY